MTDKLDTAIREVAEILHTGTPPGKPPTPVPSKYLTATITGVHTAYVDVAFPSDPAASAITMALPFCLTNRTLVVGDVVLVLHTGYQRIVIAAISH